MNVTHLFRIQSALAVTAFFLLAGCGGSSASNQESSSVEGASASSSSSDSFDACSFFSAEKAEAALGRPVKEPESSGYNPVSRDSVCSFETSQPGGLISLRIARVGDTEADAARMRELMEEVQDVPGLGDDAFRAGGQLFVFSKGHQVMVGVTLVGTSAPERQQIAATVAEAVVSGL